MSAFIRMYAPHEAREDTVGSLTTLLICKTNSLVRMPLIRSWTALLRSKQNSVCTILRNSRRLS
jgi:hypothetical protein